jgi:8-oxo-dGTP pyrophosphatase MutT (NUDIX family)
MYSAGIVPCVRGGFVLIGRETQSQLWSGFAGKSEPGVDATPLDTALREFDEETCSVFGPKVLSTIRENPMRYLIEHIQTCTPRGFVFHLYLFDFTSFVYALPTTEARFDALRSRESNAHRLEKDRVEWIDFMSENHSRRRYRAPFFNDIRNRLLPALRRFTSSYQCTIGRPS